VERVGEAGKVIVVRSFAVTDPMCSRSRAWRLVRGTGVTVLPQLWSVVRGDMSIIGPRPREAGSRPPLVRPGITGLAQLAQLERWLSVAEQLEIDDEYARTWSLALDARIVWRTMWCVLR
jgi:lipopolysaccharide/colanic/teichoic acid biosynthesis glycosyltransferase